MNIAEELYRKYGEYVKIARKFKNILNMVYRAERIEWKLLDIVGKLRTRKDTEETAEKIMGEIVYLSDIVVTKHYRGKWHVIFYDSSVGGLAVSEVMSDTIYVTGTIPYRLYIHYVEKDGSRTLGTISVDVTSIIGVISIEKHIDAVMELYSKFEREVKEASEKNRELLAIAKMLL